MLENYTKDAQGVIYQIEREPFHYDQQYVTTRYSAAPVENMSHLRLGCVIGAIGRIPESILDVGYGSGDFLKCATQIITDVSGYDVPPAYPVDGVKLADGLYGRHYDVVTFFDSIEHFSDIYEISKLDANFVHISVPWCHYFSDEWFANWKHRRPNEHLWHFDPASLESFMKSVGFEKISESNIEDTIRKSDGDWKNILSATFRKI